MLQSSCQKWDRQETIVPWVYRWVTFLTEWPLSPVAYLAISLLLWMNADNWSPKYPLKELSLSLFQPSNLSGWVFSNLAVTRQFIWQTPQAPVDLEITIKATLPAPESRPGSARESSHGSCTLLKEPHWGVKWAVTSEPGTSGTCLAGCQSLWLWGLARKPLKVFAVLGKDNVSVTHTFVIFESV